MSNLAWECVRPKGLGSWNHCLELSVIRTPWGFRNSFQPVSEKRVPGGSVACSRSLRARSRYRAAKNRFASPPDGRAINRSLLYIYLPEARRGHQPPSPCLATTIWRLVSKDFPAGRGNVCRKVAITCLARGGQRPNELENSCCNLDWEPASSLASRYSTYPTTLRIM